VDFLHSVMGEFSDKATQSEIQELQGTMEQSQNQGDQSLLQDLLNQVPSGLFGGKDQAGKADELQANAQAAQLQNTHISPREPEAFVREIEQIRKQVYPILEWHDEMMQSITEATEKIPVLPALIEQLQGALACGRPLKEWLSNLPQINLMCLCLAFWPHLSYRSSTRSRLN